MKQKRNERGGEPRPVDGQPSGHQPWHPHDRMFKEIFSTVEAQQDLVRLALPQEITARFRMDTLRESAQETKTGRIDLLLEVETQSGVTESVYVLVEHKSSNSPLVAVQLLEYVGGILRRTGKPPLPVIHPVVFYHGTDPWTVPPELTGLHGTGGPPPEERVPFGGYPVNLRYHLFNLNDIPPEDIQARTRARAYAGMIVLKYVLQKLKDGDFAILGNVIGPARIGDELWYELTMYLFEFVSGENADALMTAIQENSYTEERNKRMKSIADVLEERGLKKGIEQGFEQGIEQGIRRGRHSGKVELLMRQLHRRFGLTPEEEEIVRSCHDGDLLDAAAEECVNMKASKAGILQLVSSRQ